MKLSRILINGIIIYICIAVLFMLMEVLGLSDQVYLRLLNFIPVVYGINRTIKSNYNDHINGYFTNLMAGILTAIVSLVLGLISFTIYVEAQGEQEYLRKFAGSFIFGGGDPSIYQFCIGLALEGVASAVIVSFTLMQYWKDKVEKINKVDDTNHTSSNQ
jgi:hypothetical protein